AVARRPRRLGPGTCRRAGDRQCDGRMDSCVSASQGGRRRQRGVLVPPREPADRVRHARTGMDADRVRAGEHMKTFALAVAAITMGTLTGLAQPKEGTLALASEAGLRPNRVGITAATHAGHKAVRVVPAAEPGYGYAPVDGPVIKDGTIEVDVA